MPSKSSIDATFQSVLDSIVLYNADNSRLTAGGAGTWMFDANTDFKKSDEDTISKVFNREQINKNIIDIYNNDSGIFRDLLVNRVQQDYLQTLERDFRYRHRSKIRITCHQSARAFNHGSENTPLYKAVLRRANFDTQYQQETS